MWTFVAVGRGCEAFSWPSLAWVGSSAIIHISMPNAAATVEIPEDLRAFAEERVRSGKAATVEEVVRDALEEKRLAALREALDVGLAQADAGQVVRGTPRELMARVHERHGLSRTK
jgi:Arc/MetJ-type ribon-helix-helix transcriptional regulator